jgi:FRG domain
MPWTPMPCNSWDDFRSLVDPMIDHRPSDDGMLFRGQSVASWPLKHSLSRSLPPTIDEEAAIFIEQQALKRFQVQAHLLLDTGFIPEKKDLPSWWALMQHHHAPTRFLDWTKSPYVALYFAVIDNLSEAGVIWFFHSGVLLENMEESALPEFIKREEYEAFFQTPRSSETLFPLDLYHKSSRMIAQQGMFTVSKNILGNHHDIIGKSMN